MSHRSIVLARYREFDASTIGTRVIDLDSRFVTTTGGNVTAMLDQSGNGRNATAPGGSEPPYQVANFDYFGRPAVRFPAGDTKRLTTPSLATPIGTNPVTVFMVGHVDDAFANNRYFFMTLFGTAFSVYGSGATTWAQFAVGFPSTGKSSQIPSVTCAVFDGASSKFYANGKTAVATPTVGAHNVTSGLIIGNWPAPAGNTAASGPILRFIIYAGAMAQVDVEAGLDGLGALYGVSIAA
jgi:hypothetical protein